MQRGNAFAAGAVETERSPFVTRSVVTGNHDQGIVQITTRFELFDDPADARNFAVGLLTAIAQLERENEVQDSDPIPQDYSDIAIGDWDEVVRYGLVRREDPEGESTP